MASEAGPSPTGLPFEGEALVSVVIPTLNRLSYLQRAVRSVLAQHYPRLELIVVDGGSRDGSREWLASVTDPRLRPIELDDSLGAGHNRELGAKLSLGNFIAFLDSDDFWLPQKLSEQLTCFERQPSAHCAVISPPYAFDGKHFFPPLAKPRARPTSIVEQVYVTGGPAILSSGIMVPGRIGRELCFDRNLHVNQDTDYVIRLENSGVKLVCMDEPLWVHDTTPRGDRISRDPSKVEASMAWFKRNAHQWPGPARRGFLFMDSSLRHARAGMRMHALWLWLQNIRAAQGPGAALRQLIRALNGGEIPAGLRRLWQRLDPERDPSPQLFQELARLGNPPSD